MKVQPVIEPSNEIENLHPMRRRAGAALWRLADLVRADSPRRSFRAGAYREAVWSLDLLSAGLDESDDEMLSKPGIGKGVAGLLAELRVTGTISALDRLQAAYPIEAERMRRLPRMGPSILRDLKSMLGVETLDDLGMAVRSEAVLTLRGVGESTLDLWTRILGLRPNNWAIPSYQGWVFAERFAGHIEEMTGASAEVAGDLRRVEDWVEEIRLVVSAEEPEVVSDMLAGTALATDSRAEESSIFELTTHLGVPAAVVIAAPGEAGTRLVEATGPASHLEQFDLEVRSDSETDFYAAHGTVWVPPPARAHDLITASSVVRSEEIRGDLHVHTSLSPDGRMSLTEVVESAMRRGYDYLLITDHTKGLTFGGLDEDGLIDQASAITSIRSGGLPHIYHGAELNATIDGGLDIDEAALQLLDFAVVGVHSRFDLDESSQTKRVLRAISHPKVRILAHPTGRRIGVRPPLSLDMEAVIEAAVDLGVALEVNGHRDRLDLSSDHVAIAAEAGALFAANSDSHRHPEPANLDNAIAVLQRAAVPASRVVNTWELDRLHAWASPGKSASAQ